MKSILARPRKIPVPVPVPGLTTTMKLQNWRITKTQPPIMWCENGQRGGPPPSRAAQTLGNAERIPHIADIQGRSRSRNGTRHVVLTTSGTDRDNRTSHNITVTVPGNAKRIPHEPGIQGRRANRKRKEKKKTVDISEARTVVGQPATRNANTARHTEYRRRNLTISGTETFRD